ncbi:SH3 domain-containing protein [Salinarimonas sp.]|uniref:SH3 domain-containing protein n=1 Tax=Salinarimonas sp. TaxID=2766526 RepID=UPI0032D91EB2
MTILPPTLPSPSPLRAAGLAALARVGVLALAVLGLACVEARAERAPTADVVPGEEHCVVNVRADDPLNMRAGPGVGHQILTRLAYGTCGVMVRGDCRGTWCPVEDGHYAGWVHARYISMVSPALYCVAGVGQGERLPLRAWPSHGSRVMAELGPRACGIALLPYAREGWQKIRIEGYEGWVPRANLSGQ